MTITVESDILDPQVLTEQVQAVFAQKDAFMGSLLASQGAVMVDGSMPRGGPSAIAKTITVPYFGTLGEFVANADGSSVTPSQLTQTSEDATISRDSLAFEVSRWAQGKASIDPNLGDPYEEAARQILEAATRAMDARIVTAATAAGGLERDVYSATVPVYMDWDLMLDAKAMWGDRQEAIVAMIVHSRAYTDLQKLKDQDGKPLLVTSMNTSDPDRFAGVPLVVSDKAPLTGSTMGTVASTGTSPPVLTLAGTPTGAWDLVIDCVVGGAHATATYRFSTDGGNTWSATLVTPAVATPVALADTAIDSLVGNNGATGLTVEWAAGTFNADNQWTATANLKVSSVLCQRGALAFWYSRQALAMETDKDILAHTDIAAMHLYAAAHRYRRRRGGTKPGVVVVRHNVTGYTG